MKAVSRPRSFRSPVSGGFTLPEVMVVAAIFSLLIIATISSQIFGLKMYRISESKMTTTAGARKILDRIQGEIRSGKLLYVGTGDSYSFNYVSNNAPHIGNALRICPTTDTNIFVCYYVDANNCLNRMESSSSNVVTIATHVTNQVVFQAEDFQGNVLTNYDKNRVIRLTLQFYQRDYASGKSVGSGLYDYYQLQTRIARRPTE